MPTSFASNLLLLPVQFDTFVTKCHFFLADYVFTCMNILILSASLSLQNLNMRCILLLNVISDLISAL